MDWSDFALTAIGALIYIVGFLIGYRKGRELGWMLRDAASNHPSLRSATKKEQDDGYIP